MTTMSDQYEGNYLQGMDLAQPAEVEISAIAQPGSERDSAGKTIEQAILSFKGARKRFILNKVNWKILAAMFGKDESAWIGKRIKLACRYLRQVPDPTTRTMHKNVACVRVVPPDGTPVPLGVVKWMGSDKPFSDGK